jgi:hypothetical protein
MTSINPDRIRGTITAVMDVVRNMFITEPTILVKVPMMMADKNRRFSNEKSSSSAKINLVALLILDISFAIRVLLLTVKNLS